MSNLKITELPQSTNPLDGNEILAVVQDGETRQTTLTEVNKPRGLSHTLQDGDTINLASGVFNGYDMYKFSWFGAGGNQNATVTLPDVSDSGRMIRFITDSSFTSNTHARLTSKVNQTIDGGTEYVLNIAYEGVMIWSDGTEWFVIQAKSH